MCHAIIKYLYRGRKLETEVYYRFQMKCYMYKQESQRHKNLSVIASIVGIGTLI